MNVLFCTLCLAACAAGLFSCRKAAVDGDTFPPGTVWRAEAGGGKTLFVVRDTVASRCGGYAFLYDGEAEVTPLPFVADGEGLLGFYSGGDSLVAELQARVVRGRPVLIRRDGFRLWRRKLRPEQLYALDEDRRYDLPYRRERCDSVVVHPDVCYATAVGYYASQPTDTIAPGKMEQLRKLIVRDLARSLGRREEIPLHMDIYEPADGGTALRPLVLFMHGGSFLFGDKRNSLQQAMTESLVGRGYVVASVNYRLGISFGGLYSVERTVYRGVQDVRAAMAYLMEHAGEYRIDVGQMYLSGSSAGAIIALTTAFMDDDEVFDSVEKRIDRDDLGALRPVADADGAQGHIAGVVSLWGGLIDPGVIDRRNAGMAVLLIHGTADDIVPYESGLPFQGQFDSRMYDRLSDSWRLYGSAALYRRMQALDMSVQLLPFPGCGHEPQENADGTLNGNMDRILVGTGDFLYAQVSDYFVPGAIRPVADGGAPATHFEWEGTAPVSLWLADGGIVVEASGREARVAWLRGAAQRKVRAIVPTDEGVCFEKQLIMDN